MIVQPGDTLIFSHAATRLLDPAEAAQLRADLQSRMPGVKVVIVQGMQGDSFVYRPAPSMTPEQAEVNRLLMSMFTPKPGGDTTAP